MIRTSFRASKTSNGLLGHMKSFAATQINSRTVLKSALTHRFGAGKGNEILLLSTSRNEINFTKINACDLPRNNDPLEITHPISKSIGSSERPVRLHRFLGSWYAHVPVGMCGGTLSQPQITGQPGTPRSKSTNFVSRNTLQKTLSECVFSLHIHIYIYVYRYMHI